MTATIVHKIILALPLLIAGGSFYFPLHQQSQPQSGAKPFSGAKAGDERTIGRIKLVWCPPGRFRMGSPPNEVERRYDETQIDVTLTKGFWMGKYEVTQGEWRRLSGEVHGQLNKGAGEDFPVYWVSYTARIRAYAGAARLSKMAGPADQPADCATSRSAAPITSVFASLQSSRNTCSNG